MMSSHSKRPTPSSSKRPTTGSSSWPVPVDDAHQIRHRPVFGSNSRSVKPSNPGRPGKSGALVGVDVPEAADDRLCACEPRVELDPLVVALDERVDALAVRDLPGPEEEVEVVPAVLCTHRSSPPLRPMIEPAAYERLRTVFVRSRAYNLGECPGLPPACSRSSRCSRPGRWSTAAPPPPTSA